MNGISLGIHGLSRAEPFRGSYGHGVDLIAGDDRIPIYDLTPAQAEAIAAAINAALAGASADAIEPAEARR